MTTQLFIWDNFVHFQCAILWIFSIVIYTSLPIALIYGIVVMKRKSDFRKGWARRLEFAQLKLMRVFLGTSRLMVVHFERFDELPNNQGTEGQAGQVSFENRDFLGEDYSSRPAGYEVGADSGLISKREKLIQFVERSSKTRETHKFKFLEGRDCPICLAPFKNEDTIIQLRCHKFHVYHETCLNEMLSYSEIEAKCLMCRTCILNHEFIPSEWVA